MTIHIEADKDHFGQAIGLYIFDIPDFRRTADGVEHPISIATEITMGPVTPGTTAYRDPSLRITKEAAQDLMDTLFDCGIRPTQQQDRSGEIAALKGHLADLQRLVFSSLETVNSQREAAAGSMYRKPYAEWVPAK